VKIKYVVSTNFTLPPDVYFISPFQEITAFTISRTYLLWGRKLPP